MPENMQREVDDGPARIVDGQSLRASRPGQRPHNRSPSG
jgi:hypothetical protein